jgi:hypothetical protein
MSRVNARTTGRKAHRRVVRTECKNTIGDAHQNIGGSRRVIGPSPLRAAGSRYVAGRNATWISPATPATGWKE